MGGGDGLSQSTPFRVSDFWSVAVPGKSLCLLDGVYRGPDSTIAPPDNLSGASGAPISVRALNDGAVRIDGESVNDPILLGYNSWFVVEGINAHNGVGSVVALSRGAQFNVIRRVVAWDAKDENNEVVGAHYCGPNLLEDVAAFGVGRKTFQFSQGGDDTTCRRCWGRWEGSTNVGPKTTLEVVYNNYRALVENFIGTWNGGSMPASYTRQHNGVRWAGSAGVPAGTFSGDEPDQPCGIICGGANNSSQLDPNAYARVLGSMVYVPAGARFQGGAGLTFGSIPELEVANTAVFIDHTSFPSLLTIDLSGNEQGNAAHHLTSVGGAGANIAGGWNPSNVVQGQTVTALPSVFSSTAGAQLCFRYQDGVLTDQPLWPWPMNRRILEATTLAAEAGHRHWVYQGDPPMLTLYTQPHAVADVTAEIEAAFGLIPPACRSSQPPTDAGVGEPDAGARPPDGGSDGGEFATDAGVPQLDGGSSGTDAEPGDAGPGAERSVLGGCSCSSPSATPIIVLALVALRRSGARGSKSRLQVATSADLLSPGK